jgi:hypothetical protein
MAEPKRRDRPKGSELRASLKTKKPVRTPALEELPPRAPGALAGSAAGAVGAEATDPFLSRNEFKEGFYSQPSQPATTAETMYGKGTKRGFEYPIVDPDTKMMQDAQGMADGGSVRGQKAIQVKKKQFKGIF